MLVLVKRAGKPPVAEQIDETNKLAELQALVNGYVEQIPLENGIVMLLNEDGRIMKLPPNLVSYRGVLVGTIVFCGVNKDDWVGLKAEQERYVRKYCTEMGV